MKNSRFWNWDRTSQDSKRVLRIDGVIAEDSWFDDDVTPEVFREELEKEEGDIILWINSPGGDCVAAAQIYNMLRDYKGSIKVQIDGLAASAASVIAMAGDEVLMSPVSMLMIHNPMTVAIGDGEEMTKAYEMLKDVKESIINAYQTKTHLSRKEISKLMDAETWFDVNKAIEFGFCDGFIEERNKTPPDNTFSMIFSRKAVTNSLISKIKGKVNEHKTEDILERLEELKNYGGIQ